MKYPMKPTVEFNSKGEKLCWGSCSHCPPGTYKPTSHFHVSSKRKCKLDYWCADCESKRKGRDRVGGEVVERSDRYLHNSELLAKLTRQGLTCELTESGVIIPGTVRKIHAI